MAKNKLLKTEQVQQQALLVGAKLATQDDMLSLDDSLEELELLTQTAGIEVVGHVTQNLQTPNPKTY
ncbi:MAG: GTPase HflX, partial [Chloroflexi bacterium]|nr:GTPase HflX [Chloroflexota bacterium]